MFARLLATDASVTRFVQRLVLGAVILPHGLQKLVGWFGGYGFTGTMGFLTGAVGLPYPIAVLVIVAESAGALGLISGLLTRVAAFGVAAVMIGAVVTSHLSNGFFMNWAGTQSGEGFEYHLLALALALPLVVAGGGAWSLDGLLAGPARQAGSTATPLPASRTAA